MKLTSVERFALQMLFHEPDIVSSIVRVQLDTLEIVSRKMTGVGFFTTIHLMTPLTSFVQRQWDWNFDHRHLSHGGSFICWFEDVNTLQLEAVAHNGEWPEHFDPDDFKEEMVTT